MRNYKQKNLIQEIWDVIVVLTSALYVAFISYQYFINKEIPNNYQCLMCIVVFILGQNKINNN